MLERTFIIFLAASFICCTSSSSLRTIRPLGVFFTIVLLNFIAFWNDYQTPMIYIPSYPTLAYGLYYYVSGSFEQETSSVPMRLAGCVMVAIPLFIIFIAFQKKLLGGVSMGGLK